MKRIMLKLSGEALAGEKHTGFDEPTVLVVAEQVRQLADAGIQVGIVIGGGNFWRGRTSEHIGDRYELYLCVGDFPFCGALHTDSYAICLRRLYKAVFKRSGE